MNDMVDQIADGLLQDHVELMEENKRLREEVARLKRVPISEDKLWEMWNADYDEDSPEWFASFKHTARWVERVHGIKEDE